MSELVILPTQMAEWYGLINIAEANCNTQLVTELETYLVFLLMRFATRPEIVNGSVATELLDSLQVKGELRNTRLQDVGDKCLLISGLFPGLTKRRHVADDYFIATDIG